MDKRREDFDKFAQHWRYETETDEDGFFVAPITQRVWDSWNAALDSLVVKLPPETVRLLYPTFGETQPIFSMAEVKSMLYKAGIKYK
jgi:hypothetical protein